MRIQKRPEAIQWLKPIFNIHLPEYFVNSTTISKAEVFKYVTFGDQIHIVKWRKKGEWVIVRIIKNIRDTLVFGTVSVGPVVGVLFLTGVISLA